MRTAEEWFEAYAVSHQNEINQAIHFICVPAIYFSIVGLLMSIPADVLSGLIDHNLSWIFNWATAASILTLGFYWKLGTKVFVRMLLFNAFCIAANHYIDLFASLLFVSLAVFASAWIGQFYGHKIEGKKPSFLEDLKFLLIGPAWVMKKLIG